MSTIPKKKRGSSSVRKIFTLAVLISSVATPLVVSPSLASETTLVGRSARSAGGVSDDAYISDPRSGIQNYITQEQNPKPAAFRVSLAGHIVTGLRASVHDAEDRAYRKKGKSWRNWWESGQANALDVPIAKLSLQAVADVDLAEGIKFGAVVRSRFIPTISSERWLGTDGMSQKLKTWNDPVQQIDRAYVYLQGRFGQVQLGAVDNPSLFMHYTAPRFMRDDGIDDPSLTPSLSGHLAVGQSSYAAMTRRSNKVAFYTPRVAGVQFGAAFTPNALPPGPFSGPSDNALTIVNGDESAKSVVDLALNYAFQYKSKYELGLDGYLSSALTSTKNASFKSKLPMEFGIGFETAFHSERSGSVRFGGALRMAQNILTGSRASVRSGEVFGVGVIGLEYDVKDLSMGVSFLGAQRMRGGKGDKLNPEGTREVPYNMAVKIGGSYRVQDGVRVGLELDVLRNGSSLNWGRWERSDFALTALAGVRF